MLSSTVENYLKALWSLQQRNGGERLVPIGRVAEKLSVTPGTVTTMMNQLVKLDLVDYTPRRGARLNDHGRTMAMRVLRRHRLVESFLVEIMQLDWAEVHEEAEVLEHVISDRLLARMDDMLGQPTHDPHGAPIPNAEGKMVADTTHALSECEPGDYILTRVREDRPDFLQWLAKTGLKPGIKFQLSQLHPHAGTLSLIVSKKSPPLQISMAAAQSLLVSSTSINR
ncbi:MAG: iron dependent repressor, metal binding and dimerization domain protein [Akkermansiaceae bacterium]